jgi:hypothetical protein
LPVPAEREQVIEALCRRMKRRSGRDIQHRFVSFPPDTVSGLWVATDTTDYILCEEQTSPWHQLLITGHEFWHVEADHQATTAAWPDISHLESPTPEPTAVSRIVASRCHYNDVAEQEADLFASLLLAKLTRWLPKQIWHVPDSAAAVVHRLEETLGTRPVERETP